MKLFSTAAFVVLQAIHCYAQEPMQVDVCKLLELPTQFNKALVAVRAIVRSVDGPKLVGDVCPNRIVVDTVTFPNAIAIDESIASPIPFEVSHASVQKLTVALDKLNPSSQYLTATLVGIFETRDSLAGLVLGHGLTTGYGPLGRAPARLILREATDISVALKPPAPAALSVCALLKNPLAMNGKLVAVTGTLRAYQGWWLYEDQCSSRISVEGHTFENVIAVARPTDPVRIHDVPFDTDEDSLVSVTNAFGKDGTIHPRVSVTFVGLFETRADLKLISPVGSSRGFGHLGAAPAQLLLKECREVNVEYTPFR